MYKKKELQLSYFSICEGKKLDDKIVTYFALKTGSTVHMCILIGVCTEFSILNCLLFLATWSTGNFLVKNSIPDNILNFNCDKA